MGTLKTIQLDICFLDMNFRSETPWGWRGLESGPERLGLEAAEGSSPEGQDQEEEERGVLAPWGWDVHPICGIFLHLFKNKLKSQKLEWPEQTLVQVIFFCIFCDNFHGGISDSTAQIMWFFACFCWESRHQPSRGCGFQAFPAGFDWIKMEGFRTRSQPFQENTGMWLKQYNQPSPQNPPNHHKYKV